LKSRKKRHHRKRYEDIFVTVGILQNIFEVKKKKRSKKGCDWKQLKNG
jgi:hypothetical protein